MVTVNNFITDLLDEMLAKDGTLLMLEAGHRPLIEIDNIFQTIPGTDIIEQDELVYDLEALGIRNIAGEDISGQCSFAYAPVNEGIELRFDANYYTTFGRLHFAISKSTSSGNRIIDLLENMPKENASTLFLSAGYPPFYTVQGEPVEVPGYGEMQDSEITLEMQDIGLYMQDGDQKAFSHTIPNEPAARFRVSADMKNGRTNIVFRYIPTEIKPLGLPSSLSLILP